MPHACHRFWKCYKTTTFCSLLTRCTIPCPCHAKRRFNVQKWCEHVVFLCILISKCASRHNRVHFFDISISKSGLNVVCFVHFVLRTTTAGTFSTSQLVCTCWLGNVLRATTACNFSSLIWPAGSAPAALASLLFDPPEPQEKHSVSRLSYRRSHLDLLSSETFSFLIFFLLLFSSLTLPSLLFISSVHIVTSLTSKLPSIICCIILQVGPRHTRFVQTSPPLLYEDPCLCCRALNHLATAAMSESSILYSRFSTLNGRVSCLIFGFSILAWMSA